MPKPIRATTNMLEETRKALLEKVEEYMKKLESGILSNGCIEYKMPYAYPDSDFERPQVEFTAEAWAKMTALVCTTSSEIAWNGIVDRIDETHFKITDILVYPQVVSGATVDIDEGERGIWLGKIPREQRCKLNFQGHSHVNMSPNPSSTDMSSRKDVVEILDPEDGYFIFFIMNKSFEFTAAIYDMVTNMLYDTKEIDFVIPIEDNLLEWCKNEKKYKLSTKTYSYGGSYGSYNSKGFGTKGTGAGSSVKKFPATTGSGAAGSSEGAKPGDKKSDVKGIKTLSELNITKKTLMSQCMINDKEADAVMEMLFEEVNDGMLFNTYYALLKEARDITWGDSNSSSYDYDGYGGYGGWSSY